MVVSMVSWGNYDLGVAEYKKRNFSRAFIEFKKASREDDVRAQTALALMYKYVREQKQISLWHIIGI